MHVSKMRHACSIHSARLVAILDAYLNSRKIDKSYDRLTELLVCDRIKSTLPEGCLRHILAIESSTESGWLPVHELAEAVDLYFANRWQHGDRPRAGALGISATAKSPSSAGRGSRPYTQLSAKPVESPDGSRGANNYASTPQQAESSRRCYTCGSKSHLKNECPERTKPHRTNAKVSTCQIQTAGGVGDNPVPSPSLRAPHVVDAEVQVCADIESDTSTPTDKSQELTVEVHSVVNDKVCEHDDYARLEYVDVKLTDCINSDVKVLSALCDSGVQMSVLHVDIAGNLRVN